MFSIRQLPGRRERRKRLQPGYALAELTGIQIVIASLTRNNPSRDIGWLAQSERLNVLLSRARNALILIGNAETFVNARKGKAMWNQLFDELKRGGHIYDGFPVKCERHPERKALLKTPEEFDSETPDGGCKEAW